MARWSRETALEYLASNPNFSPIKPLNDYTTPYLKRTASQFQDAERAGRAAPSTAKRRGHERFTHLEAKGNRLNQWAVEKPRRRDISQADLQDAFTAAKKSTGKGDGDDVSVIITGIVKYKPRRGSVPSTGIQSVSFPTLMISLQDAIEEFTDIIEFSENITQLEWVEVHAVSFAFPNERRKK